MQRPIGFSLTKSKWPIPTHTKQYSQELRTVIDMCSEGRSTEEAGYGGAVRNDVFKLCGKSENLYSSTDNCNPRGATKIRDEGVMPEEQHFYYKQKRCGKIMIRGASSCIMKLMPHYGQRKFWRRKRFAGSGYGVGITDPGRSGCTTSFRIGIQIQEFDLVPRSLRDLTPLIMLPWFFCASSGFSVSDRPTTSFHSPRYDTGFSCRHHMASPSVMVHPRLSSTSHYI